MLQASWVVGYAHELCLWEVWVSLQFPALPSVLCVSLYHSETKPQNKAHVLTDSDTSEWGCEHVCSRWAPGQNGASLSSRQGLKQSNQDLHSWASQPGPRHCHAWDPVRQQSAEAPGSGRLLGACDTPYNIKTPLD